MASVKQLRALLADTNKIIVCPGVYDGLTARIALNAGYDCLYMVTQTPILKLKIVSDSFLPFRLELAQQYQDLVCQI